MPKEEPEFVTSSTGGKKQIKKARFDLIPAGPLWQLAELYGRGAEKYGDSNWRKGYGWSLSFAALMRHAWKFWWGEDIDEETGMPHMACAAFHCFTLLEFMTNHRAFDDRYERPLILASDTDPMLSNTEDASFATLDLIWADPDELDPCVEVWSTFGEHDLFEAAWHIQDGKVLFWTGDSYVPSGASTKELFTEWNCHKIGEIYRDPDDFYVGWPEC